MSVEHVTQEYDNIVASLQRRWQNIDPFLLIKSSMLKRKYPRERKQRFFLEIHYNQGINEDGKSRQMHDLVGKFPNNHGHGHYQIDLQSDLETVMAIAADRDIKWLGGEVYPN